MHDDWSPSPEPSCTVATAPPLQVVAVTSNKGGVGKTTIAANLAVYLRALCEDLPILYLSLDDQPMPERMFALPGAASGRTIEDWLRGVPLGDVARLGQYGVHYVPSSPDLSALKAEVRDPLHLRALLAASGWRGLVVLDTKGDFEILTRNAITAADLTLVAVSDEASLIEARKVFDLLERWHQPRERARIVLSLVDRRIRYREGESRDVLSLLVSRIRREGYPLLESFLARSPKVESLYTNPEGRAISILHGAASSPAHMQMRHLADDVRAALAAAPQVPWTARTVVEMEPLTALAAASMSQRPLQIEAFPFRIGRLDSAVQNDLMLADSAPLQVSRNHVALIEEAGRVGVIDVGSRLGASVDGRRLGGAAGSRGPLFFDALEGTLVLGRSSSPFRFQVRVDRLPGRAVRDRGSERPSPPAARGADLGLRLPN